LTVGVPKDAPEDDAEQAPQRNPAAGKETGRAILQQQPVIAGGRSKREEWTVRERHGDAASGLVAGRPPSILDEARDEKCSPF
jgi:hypothetical protein